MPEEIERFPDLEYFGPEPAVRPDPRRLNPRYLFIDPDSDFGREFYADLLMEQQEQF